MSTINYQLSNHPRWHPIHWLVVAATLLAAVVRFWQLNSLPPQAWYDEAWFALRARELIEYGNVQAFYDPSQGSGNAALVYLAALAQWLGVRSLVSARLATAAAGVMAVPLAYACLRELLRDTMPQRRRATAALSAVVMAYLLFPLILSRVGMEPGLMAALILLIAWQLMRGMRYGSWSGWVLAGLAMGVAQYNGLHARFVIPLAAYLMAEGFFGSRDVGRRRAIVKGALVMAAVSVMASLPLMVAFAQHPGWLTGRAATVSIFSGATGSTPAALFDNTLRVLGAWLFAGDANPRHNLPGQPILDPILAVGFVAGVGWSIVRFRRSPAARVMLIWTMWMAVPAILTVEAPNMQRMIGIVPPTVALAAAGWMQIIDKVRPSWGARKGWLTGLGLALLGASLGWNMYLFWGRWAQSPRLPVAFDAAVVSLGREMAQRAESERVVVERLPGTVDVIFFEYLFADTTIGRVDFSRCLPLVDQAKTRTSYLVLAARDTQTIARLQAIYPESRVTAEDMGIWSLDGTATAALLETPAGAAIPLPQHRPPARFAPGLSLYGYNLSGELKAGQTLSMRIYWAVEGAVGANLTPFIHIIPAGVYDQPPVAQHDGPPCAPLYPTSQWQPGEIIMDWFDIPLPAGLPPGDYEMTAGWYDPVTAARAPVAEADAPLPGDRAIIGRLAIE